MIKKYETYSVPVLEITCYLCLLLLLLSVPVAAMFDMRATISIYNFPVMLLILFGALSAIPFFHDDARFFNKLVGFIQAPNINRKSFILLCSLCLIYLAFIPLQAALNEIFRGTALAQNGKISHAFFADVIYAPISEEVAFRLGLFLALGCIFRFFKSSDKSKFFTPIFVLLSVLMFTFAHVWKSPIGLVSTGITSIILCYVFLHYRSVFIPILLHMSNNLIAYISNTGILDKFGINNIAQVGLLYFIGFSLFVCVLCLAKIDKKKVGCAMQ